jgi:hypothetical protein
VSKFNLTYAPVSSVERWNGLRLFRRATRALLRALHDSREGAARKIIHDYRHLLPERPSANSSQDGRKGTARESQGNLKGMG